MDHSYCVILIDKLAPQILDAPAHMVTIYSRNGRIYNDGYTSHGCVDVTKAHKLYVKFHSCEVFLVVEISNF